MLTVKRQTWNVALMFMAAYMHEQATKVKKVNLGVFGVTDHQGRISSKFR